jgi:hypothetical protein
MNTKRNLLLFLALLALTIIWYVTVFIVDVKNTDVITDAFPKIIPAQITAIKIYAPANDKVETHLYKKGDEWRVLSGVTDAPIQFDLIPSIFEEIVKLNATRVAGISSQQWFELGITDSLATRMIIYTEKGALTDLLFGKFHYKTPSIKPLNPQIKTDTKGITYVRKFGEERVYSAENFFGPTFNQHSEVWRDHYLLRFDLNQLQRIVIADSDNKGYEIETTQNGWFLNEKLISDQKMIEYAGNIRMLRHNLFADGFRPTGEPLLRAVFDIKEDKPIIISAYEDEMGRTVIHSSVNPETYFYDHDGTLTNRIFFSMDEFLR